MDLLYRFYYISHCFVNKHPINNVYQIFALLYCFVYFYDSAFWLSNVLLRHARRHLKMSLLARYTDDSYFPMHYRICNSISAVWRIDVHNIPSYQLWDTSFQMLLNSLFFGMNKFLLRISAVEKSGLSSCVFTSFPYT